MTKANDDYDAPAIEKRWQEFWEETALFEANEDSSRPKFYLLEMFPYPSGDLHVGHMKNYFIGDVLGRYKMMRGYEVLHPIGWDSFGLPAENAAIQRGVSPTAWTEENIATSRETLKRAGVGYDWRREVAACRPDYYKWTQWLFLKLYERGLAYRASGPANFCPSCNTVLANEQVVEGACYRCDTPVERRHLKQWYFKITAYADRLLDDLELIEKNWPRHVATLQRNWIGRSEGLTVRFPVVGGDDRHFDVFTTRADTLYGVTFMALAPEHPAIAELTEGLPTKSEVETFCREATKKKEIDRTSAATEKAGVFTGRCARNPLSGEEMPIWVADYVCQAGRGRPEGRLGPAGGQLPPPRLAHKPPALLGRAHTGSPLPDLRRGAGPLRRAAGTSSPRRRGRLHARGALAARELPRVHRNDVPEVRRPGGARRRYDGHLRRLELVLPALLRRP